MIVNHYPRPLEKQDVDTGQSPKRVPNDPEIILNVCVCVCVNVYAFLEKGFNGFHQILKSIHHPQQVKKLS